MEPRLESYSGDDEPDFSIRVVCAAEIHMVAEWHSFEGGTWLGSASQWSSSAVAVL